MLFLKRLLRTCGYTTINRKTYNLITDDLIQSVVFGEDLICYYQTLNTTVFEMGIPKLITAITAKFPPENIADILVASGAITENQIKTLKHDSAIFNNGLRRNSAICRNLSSNNINPTI